MQHYRHIYCLQTGYKNSNIDINNTMYHKQHPVANRGIRKSGFSNARHKGDCKGASPFAGARGVLAPSTSPSRRRRHKGELESPDKKVEIMI